jgi:hypothetical protein
MSQPNQPAAAPLLLPQPITLTSRLLKLLEPTRRFFSTDAHWPLWAQVTLVVLLVLFGWQCIWWQRASIAWAVPVFDAPLQRLAASLGTSTAQPASSNIVIVGSNLSYPTDKTLKADLRIAHRGKAPSYWPVFQLQLLNSQQAVVASKVIGLSEYAIQTKVSAQSIAPRVLPGEEVDIVILFNISKLLSANAGVPPTGFRVTLYDQRL